LNGIQPARAGNSPAASDIERGAGLADARGNPAGDQVELSDLTGRLARALQADAARRVNRVQELSKNYQAGLYHTDPTALSRALLREAVSELESASALEK
jgi:hypothetical protein